MIIFSKKSIHRWKYWRSKSIIVLFPAICLTTNIFSQITFEKMYNQSDYALYGRGTLVKADTSGYYLGGYGIVNGGIQSTLIKTDWQGNLLWKQLFPNEYGTVRIINRDNPTEFIFLNNPSNMATKSDVKVTNVNSAGTVNWSKTYVKQNWDEPDQILQTSDKGFLVVGHSNSLPGIMVPHPYDAYILKLSQYGDTLWSKMTGERTINEYAWDAVETADSQYFVTGNDAQGRLLLIKLDSSGTIRWIKKYSKDFHNQPNCIALTNDNNLLIVGTCTPVNTYQSIFYAIKTDTTGNVLMEKTYAASSQNYRPALQMLKSGFLIAGHNQEDKVVLVKATNEGELSWSRTLQTQAQGSVSSIDVCNDGGFLLANQYCFSLIKTDSTGCVKPCILAVDGERTVSQYEAITFNAHDLRASTYHWSTAHGTVVSGQGSKQLSISWNETGTDTLKLVIENECGKDSIQLKINILECVPLKLSPIQQSGYFDFFVEKIEGKTPVYTWLVDHGTIVSGQHTNHIVVDWATTGELKVAVKASNDCSVVEDSIAFFYDKLNLPDEDIIQVYPASSNDGIFQITSKQDAKILLQVFSNSGQLISTAGLEGKKTMQIDISSHGKGMYLLKIIADKRVETKKIWF